jgi:hypothetical protein
LALAGFLCAFFALFLLPPLFGIAGLILGGLAMSRGDSLGLAALITSGVTMAIGMFLGIIAFGGF